MFLILWSNVFFFLEPARLISIYFIHSDVEYILLVYPINITSASFYSHLTLTSAGCDFPLPMSLVASQLYSPLSEGLAEFTVKVWVWVCWTISSLPSVVFLQVTALTGGLDSAIQLSVNDTFSFTSRPGLAWTVTFFRLSAVTNNTDSRELSDLTTVQYNGLYNIDWPCIIDVFYFIRLEFRVALEIVD